MMKISAIIPVFNGKKYVREAVESVINQKLKPIELIIIDDGSTDGSTDTLTNIESSFPIRIIKQKNTGQSAARNRGISISEGDFIALLDQDDYWYPNHLEVLAKPFHDNDQIGWAYSNVDEWDHKGRLLKKNFLDFVGADHPKKDIAKMISEDMYILPSASLIRKKAIIDIGMFDERFSGYEDDDLFIRLFLAGWDNAYIKTSLVKWRIHGESCGQSQRMTNSRRLFTNKIIEIFQDLELRRFSTSEIIGKRFFEQFIIFYKHFMLHKDYEKCKSFVSEIKYFYSLMHPTLRKNWKFKIFFLKYPKLMHVLYKIRDCVKNLKST